MKRQGPWVWPIFLIGAAGVVALLVWCSVLMLEAEGKAHFESHLRAALWRMDTRVVEFLSREAERPHTAYMPLHFVEQVYTKMYREIEPEEVLAPSALIRFRSDVIRLHFQVDENGSFSSPQVPRGNVYEVAVPALLSEKRYEANVAELRHIESLVDPASVAPRIARSAGRQIQTARQGSAERAKRGQAAQPPSAETSVGPLEPIWIADELFYVRSVEANGGAYLQGFLLDWPALKSGLLGEIDDLFRDPDLVPAGGTNTDRTLFTLPATLVVAAEPPDWSATHTALALLWPLVVLGIGMACFALARSIRFGEHQRRFASLVTHELRSPLTTFRLYSDLLAEGMVREPGQVEEYHKTLQRESDQMARIVENVIAHTRVEEGRAQLHPERITVGELLQRLEPTLRKPVAEAGVELEFAAGEAREAALVTDADAVGQILLNLVENACKYGGSEHEPAIRIEAAVRGAQVELSVRDYGAGIPRELAQRIFRPFERGARHDAGAIRGLGLGLALSRGLARDLGGSLSLEAPADGGARFVLRLPAD